MMTPTSRNDDENDDEIIFLGKRPRLQTPSSSITSLPDVELVRVVNPVHINNLNTFLPQLSPILDVQEISLNVSTITTSSSLFLSQPFPKGPIPNVESSLSEKLSPTEPSSSSSTLSIDNQEYHCNRCSICLEPFGKPDTSHHLVTLKCGHLFGKSCIEQWLKPTDHRKCPTCKKPATIKQMIKIYADNLPANQSFWSKYQDALKQLEHYKNEAEKAKKMKSKKSNKGK